MNEAREKVYELLWEINTHSYGEAQIALAEEAVRAADLSGELELQLEARYELIGATVHGGESEKAIVAFTWCLKQHDEHPDEVESFRFFWQYKWILNNIPNFPAVPRAQIESIFADATRRYEREGLSLRPIYGERCLFEMRSGRREAAAEYYRQWLAAPRDYNADCLACETDRQAHFLAFYERDEEALKIAEPILKGRQSCAEIPHLTLGNLLLPLLRLGELELAAECFTKGYRLVSKNKDFLLTVAQQIQFLALVGKFRKGLSLLERHLAWALETKNEESRFHFYKSAALLLKALDRKTIRLRLPDGWPAAAPDGRTDRAALAARFFDEAAAIAARFDRRNGNDFFAAQLAAADALRERFAPLRAGGE